MMTKKDFGFVNGYKVFLFTLTNKNGMRADLTNYSGAVVNLFVPDKNGKLGDVVLGYESLEGYVNGTSSQGALVGRYANRIANSEFTLNGEVIKLRANENANCLHGGLVGFNKRVWTVDETSDNSVTFGYLSPDGEENFPGTVKVTCKYTLTDENELKLEYTGVSDADTVLNLTNHTYFNLGGAAPAKTILDHELQLFADKYTPVNSALIPTGEQADVAGTPFDFRTPKRIGKDVDAGLLVGYDHNFMLGEPHVMRKAAVVFDAETGREMTVFTDKPAIQIYTAVGLGPEMGKGGKEMEELTAICLESQFAPDSPNQPDFPSCVLKKGEEYRFTTVYAFGIRK